LGSDIGVFLQNRAAFSTYFMGWNTASLGTPTIKPLAFGYTSGDMREWLLEFFDGG